MMRSGLEKPSAIPFLALIVFWLLSLMPSLSSGDWNWNWNSAWYGWKHAYLACYRSEVGCADFSRVVDGVPDTRLRVRERPWLRSDASGTPHSRYSAIDNTASPSAFEIAHVWTDRCPTTYPKNSSTLTRSVRAFTTYFIQRLDDHQLLPSFTARSLSPVETAPLRPSNVSLPTPLSSDGISSQQTVNDHNVATPSTNEPHVDTGLQFCDRFSSSWERVCHAANGLYTQAKTLPTIFGTVGPNLLCSKADPSSSTSSDLNRRTEIAPRTLLPGDSGSSPSPSQLESSSVAASPATKNMHPNANALFISSGDSPDAGTGHNPRQVRGSCMAIVIGLVVGVMWF